MTEKQDGGPAFPRSKLGDDCDYPFGQQDGMSLRDAAALAALPAIINVCKNDIPDPGETFSEMFARKAFGCADAFIAARTGR